MNCEDTFVQRHKIWKETGELKIEIDESMVKRLSQIIKRSNARVVLSSTWRKGFYFNNDGKCIPGSYKDKELDDILKLHRIEIFGLAPCSRHGIRQEEIKQWLDSHGKNVSSFVIIDDETFDLKDYCTANKVVKTSWKEGLQDIHIEQAIDILFANGG